MTSAWPPTRHSPPLAESHPSLFERYAGALDIAWLAATGHSLDGWQQSTLHAITELFPAGHARAGQLRYRRVLISVARQNGKTELAAALGLLVMLARADGLIVGIASSAEQARLVYRRAMRVIERNKALKTRFEALTETRGIRAKNGTVWEIKPAKSAALNGPPIDLGIVDEVHLVKQELWTDLVNGTGSRPDTLVVGITTAGDDNSALLKALYKAADEGDDARFGHFIWEAPKSRVPADDDELTQYLLAANPYLAEGRGDLENAIADVRSMPPADAIHYRLNRFVSATSSFINPDAWLSCTRAEDDVFPPGRPVFTIDRTPDWGYATVTATTIDDNGMIWTEVVASLVKPDLDRLEAVCQALAVHSPAWYVMDGYALKELGARLKKNGHPTQILTQADVISASSMFYGKVTQRKLRHAGDPLLTAQIPKTSRKNVGTAFRIIRVDSGCEIDAVMATVLGIYIIETVPAEDDQLFI